MSISNKQFFDLCVRVTMLENQAACTKGEHALRFYDLRESSIPGDYYIRHSCPNCKKLFQRDLTPEEEKLLRIHKEPRT